MLDADPIGSGPEQVRFGRDIIAARQSRASENFLRLYVAEPGWTLTGALADHRVALSPGLIRNIALAVARELGADVPAGPLPAPSDQFAKAAAADLAARRGAAMVLAGPRQSAEVHALCHWINAALRAPVDFIAPIDPVVAGHAEVAPCARCR